MHLSVSVTRSVTRLHFFLVDTLGSASFFSFFLPSPFRLIARSPSPVFLPVSLCGSHHLLILCYLYLPFLLSVPSSLLWQRLRTLLRRRDRQMFTRLSAVTNRSLQCISKALELTGWLQSSKNSQEKNYISLKILSRFGSDVVWFLSSKLCGVRGLKLSWNSLVIMPSKSVRSCSSFKMRLNAGESSDYALFKAL